MKKLLIRRTAKKYINIHNDISNTANHLRTRVEEMDKAGNREGISLDITACLVLLAFTFESRLNFIGHHKVGDWCERERFPTKLKIVRKALNLKPDYSVRPYSSIRALQDFRNTIAHGKPIIIEINETIEGDPDAHPDDMELRAPWEESLTTTFMRQCSDDIDEIWKEWLNAAEIDSYQTLTHGEFGYQLLEGPNGLGG